jgi:hypothetical protein
MKNKLILNKEIVSELNFAQMVNVRGGERGSDSLSVADTTIQAKDSIYLTDTVKMDTAKMDTAKNSGAKDTLALDSIK